MTDYAAFLASKRHLSGQFGFDPIWMPDFLFDFQSILTEWAIRRGRGAIFADCGLGKTPMQLVWAKNVADHADGKVLILTPLAVGAQTVREAEKFGIEAVNAKDQSCLNGHQIAVTNYERLHHFDPAQFVGCVCDESSILKNFKGATRRAITDFMRKLPYRLLCTATAAPNDYTELGTSSEAIGDLGFIDMLQRFFKSDNGSYAQGSGASGKTRFSLNGYQGRYRFRGHAERDFWRWVCSWARAVRCPSDLGCDPQGFALPSLVTREHIVQATRRPDGFLFDMPAVTLAEQRSERRRTIEERCDMVRSIVASESGPVVCWVNLNAEGDTLRKIIPESVEVRGDDDPDRKEQVFEDFASGAIRVLVTKPTIAGYGLNWQHCSHQTFFTSHSFEQFYQAVRRSWRFGQTRTVTVDVIASEGERGVLSNLQRKADAADRMFEHLVSLMNNEMRITHEDKFRQRVEAPVWMSLIKN